MNLFYVIGLVSCLVLWIVAFLLSKEPPTPLEIGAILVMSAAPNGNYVGCFWALVCIGSKFSVRNLFKNTHGT